MPEPPASDGAIVLWKWISNEPSRKGLGADDDDLNKETWAAVQVLRYVRPGTVKRFCHPAPLTRSRSCTRCPCAYRRTGPDGEIYDLAWAPKSNCILSASIDHTARVWDLQSGAALPSGVSLNPANPNDACASTAQRRGASGQCIRRFADHTHYVQGVSWDPLERFVATQSNDR